MEAGEAWVKNIETVEMNKVTWLSGEWTRIVDLSSERERGLVFIVGRLEAGEVADWHQHPEDEVFFVFKGEGEVRWRIDEEEFSARVAPGSAFFKRGGIPHQMIASATGALLGVGCKA